MMKHSLKTIILLTCFCSHVYAENPIVTDNIMPPLSAEAKSLIMLGLKIAESSFPLENPITLFEAMRQEVSLDNCTWQSKHNPELIVVLCKDSATGLIVVSEVIVSRSLKFADTLSFDFRFGITCKEVIDTLGPPLVNTVGTTGKSCNSLTEHTKNSDATLIYALSYLEPSDVLELNFSSDRLDRMRWILGE